ncbi:MAG: hypothetical protein K8R40_02815 [Anaerolineaceae bacterium]|nr:hypothetical protein [Anaerolineaceae bacterium]
MANTEERMKILEMVREGVITAEEAAKLLETMSQESSKRQSAGEAAQKKSGSKAKYFRVRVTDTDTNKTRVNVTLPMGLINVAMKAGSKFAPEIDDIDMQEVFKAIEEGATGRIVDVVDEKDGEHVEVFIE